MLASSVKHASASAAVDARVVVMDAIHENEEDVAPETSD